MKYCYVVTGTADRYAAMAAVSIASLRRVHPDAEIHLFVWPSVGASAVWKRLAALATTVHVPELPQGMDAKSASRLIKITLRQRLDGPILYLDGDTLVMRSLDELKSPRQVGMVLDRWKEAPRPGPPGWAKGLYDACGWRFPKRTYFNSGVMALPDTTDARELSDDWLARWEVGRKKGGVNLDQPSLNAAIASRPPRSIEVLPDRFNALVDADPRLASGAHVLHFFAGGMSSGAVSVFDRLVAGFTETGVVDWKMWERVLQDGWPFDSARPAAWRLSADYALRSIRQGYVNLRYELKRRIVVRRDPATSNG